MNNNRRISQIVGLTLLAALFLTACGAPQPAPTATQSPAEMNPSARYVNLAYDAKSDRIIIFGGQTGHYKLETSFNAETWTYNVTANRWAQMKPPSAPGKRSDYGLAYDAESDRVILFGGADNIMSNWGFGDTWVYDYNTNTWKELAKGPLGMLGIRLAYDSESDRIILFGGYDMKNKRFINDTWVFDYNANTWTDMKPTASPPVRNYQGMAYDSKADRVLIWGGLDENQKPVDESIWAYDFNTNTWTEMKPGNGAYPTGRDNTQMVYNAKADRTILYGGSQGENASDTETWAYDYNTNTWTNLNPAANPGKRLTHGMVYSPAADRVILFGGATSFVPFIFSNETWSYDFKTNTWTNVTPKP